MATVPYLDGQPDGRFQCIRTVIMVIDRKVLQLLHQQQHPRRTRLETQLPLRQIRTNAAEAHFLVHPWSSNV